MAAGGINKVILIGRLGGDPEVRYTATGGAVANFTLATNESWTDKQGQKQEKTEWHRIIVWGKLGEICAQYLSKGRQAYVEGRLQTREWNDKEGNKRYTTEIVAQNVQFLGSGGDKGAGAASSQDYSQASSGVSDFTPSFGGQEPEKAMADDEVPF